jgi:hypothetical protein
MFNSSEIENIYLEIGLEKVGIDRPVLKGNGYGKYLLKNSKKASTLLYQHECNKSFYHFRNLRYFFGLLFMETATEDGQKMVTIIKKKVFNSNVYEAFLESGPQFILQSSIILRTGNISMNIFKSKNFFEETFECI